MPLVNPLVPLVNPLVPLVPLPMHLALLSMMPEQTPIPTPRPLPSARCLGPKGYLGLRGWLLLDILLLLSVEWYLDWVVVEKKKGNQARVHMYTQHWWEEEEMWLWWGLVVEKKKGNQARVQMGTQHWRAEEEGMWMMMVVLMMLLLQLVRRCRRLRWQWRQCRPPVSLLVIMTNVLMTDMQSINTYNVPKMYAHM